MQNIYSTEYNTKYSKPVNFLSSLGIALLVGIGQVGLVIVIMIVKTIETVVTADSREGFDRAIDEIFKGSEFFSKTVLLITFICLIVVFICYYFSYVKSDMRKGTYESVLPKLMEKKNIGFIVCAVISVFGLTALLSGFISSIFPNKAESLSNAFENLKLSGYLYFLDAVILGPIFEELTMRGLILKISKKAYGMIGCMIINSILFSFLHGNIIQGFYVIPMGLLYAFIAFQFNSVIPTIFCHMLHNLLASYLNFGDTFGIILYLLLFLIFGALSYYLGRDLFPMFDSKPIHTTQRKSAPIPAAASRPVRPVQNPALNMDPSTDFSFFKDVPPKTDIPKSVERIWKVNLIHRQLIGSVIRNTKFTEKVFSSKGEAEKWIMSKGFVYGRNPHFGETSDPCWFHKKDTKSDYVTVKIFNMKLNDSKNPNDDWIDDLVSRQG